MTENKNENIVKCWCCGHFDITNEKLIGTSETFFGFCTLSDSIVGTQDEVCPDFILNPGLHTKKQSPITA